MSEILILGGGFGGVAAGIELRRLLDSEHRITLVDRREWFSFGFRKTWALLGEATIAAGQRPLSSLKQRGIEVRRGTIETIDPQAHSVVVDGTRLVSDALVLALGAQSHPSGVRGFREHGLDLYDATRLNEASELLNAFQGGRVAVVILGLPYPCPPAPYELALLLKEKFESRGVDAAIDVYTPQPMSLPVLGQAGCAIIESRLEANGIGFHPNHAPVAIEAGRIRFKTGLAAFELMIGIPGHVCPAVARESGLADGDGWVKVNPRTLETGYSGVYAIGDMVSIPLANGKRLPQAGVFAEAQGKVAAARIAGTISGNTPTVTYDGTGYCFLEVGGGSAMLVQGDFLAEPEPVVSILEPSPEHLEAKRELERGRLNEWFGG